VIHTRNWRRSRTRISVTVVAVAAVVASAFTGMSSAGASTPRSHPITVHPQVSLAGKKIDAVTFGCQARPLDGSQGARCYQPAQIQNAYNVAPLLNAGVTGSGRTIVIIDAFQSPTLRADLALFDQTFSLPDPNLTITAPAGEPPPFDITDDNQVGWSGEITLDVLWAHAIAPGANIVLAEAASNNDSDIVATTKAVIEGNMGDVISQSFGEAEQCMDPALLAEQHQLFALAARKRMTVFASSGDSGAAQPSCDGNSAILAASTPASDPFVTGVGGTTLDADTTTGAYIGETAWTEPFGCNPPAVAATDVNCSGGGFSVLFNRPAFQKHAIKNAHTGRGVPDVAYNAGVAGGVLVHWGVGLETLGLDPNTPAFFIFGGTSAGSPQWAGLAALGDQLGGRRMGDLNPALYGLAKSGGHLRRDFHDIAIGNNDVAEIGTGFDAVKGWDAVTGVGSPNAAALLPELVKKTR
jgi:subtilase family serine protease